jgi:hypothetical protein
MIKLFKISFILFFLGLTNCSNLKKGFGFEKDAPNEFLIKKNKSIQKPPNYDLLPPDSLTKKSEEKNNQANTKKIIDNSLKKNIENNTNISNTAIETNIENSILNKIEKK